MSDGAAQRCFTISQRSIDCAGPHSDCKFKPVDLRQNQTDADSVVNGYVHRCGVKIVPHLEIGNFSMAISLITSTRGVALLPASIKECCLRLLSAAR
jgi:hypothetical protein